MISLTDNNAIRSCVRDPTLANDLRAILLLRLAQTDGFGVHFHVVEPADKRRDAEAAIGFPLTIEGSPAWEWAQRHGTNWHEITFVLSDDGPAQVLLIRDDADASIVNLIHEYSDRG